MLGYWLASAVTLIYGIGTALGARPPVFWTTASAYLFLSGSVMGAYQFLGKLSAPSESFSNANVLLQNIRLANTMPMLAVLALCCLFGIPLLGLWARALCTDEAHRTGEFLRLKPLKQSEISFLLMISVVVVGALVGCVYYHRLKHSVAIIAICLFLILPSALLVRRGSELPKGPDWELGGSPAAFLVQGVFIFFAYWLGKRQLNVLRTLDFVETNIRSGNISSDLMEHLRFSLSNIDTKLLSALAVSHCGVMIASWLGHREICAIDKDQKISVWGWFLSIGVLLLFLAGFSELPNGLNSRSADVVEHLGKLLPPLTP